MSLFLAALCFAAGLGLAWSHPVAPAILLAAFVSWTVVVAWRPGIWLFVVPAGLPLLNFSPWTGWIVFEEFDLLVLGAIAGGYLHLALKPRAMTANSGVARSDRAAVIGLALLLGASSVVALVRGFSAPSGNELGWFQGYTDPLNSWRVFKSLLFAALMWPLTRREVGLGLATAARRLGSGMAAGLVVVTLAVLWERTAYPGLGDFSSTYRTTALFWEMHVGGAAVDAYLALATPFVAWALWTSQTPLRWALAAALALLTAYACLTTFSRGVYLAVAGPLVLLGWLLARQRPGLALGSSALRAALIAASSLGAALVLVMALQSWGLAGVGWVGSVVLVACLGALASRQGKPPFGWRKWAGLGLSFAIALEVVAVLGLGSFMGERIGASDRDAGARLQHWRNGLGLMNGPADWLLGIGLGRLPSAYATAVPGGGFPGGIGFTPMGSFDGSGSVTVLGPESQSNPAGLYALTQRVSLRPVWPYRVEFDARTGARADVLIRLCEMHLLYPRNCQAAFVRLSPTEGNSQHVAVRLRGPVLDPGRAWAPRQGVFSISLLNAGGAAEFDNISLVESDETELLVNRKFSAGLARWFPAAQGHYVPWHIDNLYLELLIERGLPALLAFAALIGLAVWPLIGGVARALPIAPFLAAALCGALCIGLISSVMDVPRAAFLTWLLAMLAFEVATDVKRQGTAPEAPS